MAPPRIFVFSALLLLLAACSTADARTPPSTTTTRPTTPPTTVAPSPPPLGPYVAPAATQRATRVTTEQVADPPPVVFTVPPGAHCENLLDAFMAAGGDPANYTWYGNVSFGETHCWADQKPNCILSGCTWGPMQISAGSWSGLCGMTGSEMADPANNFRCAFMIEEAAGRRQWRPHSEVTGLFPGQS